MYPHERQVRGIVLGPENEATVERISTGLRRCGSILAGSAKADAKIVGFSPGFVDRLLGEVQPATVVAECDGARGLSLKVPDTHEPPLGESTAVLIVVVGADCIGKPVDSDAVYRPDLVSSVTGVAGATVVTAEVVVRALLAPESYLGRLPPGARLCVMVNKADSAPGPAMEAAVALAAHRAVECVVVGALRTPGGRLMIVR